MKLVHDDIDDPAVGGWVRLTRDNATLWLGRWPRPDQPIYSTDGGWFVSGRLDPDATDGPKTVPAWVADRKSP